MGNDQVAAAVLPTLLRIGSRLLLMRVEEKEKKNEIKKIEIGMKVEIYNLCPQDVQQAGALIKMQKPLPALPELTARSAERLRRVGDEHTLWSPLFNCSNSSGCQQKPLGAHNPSCLLTA